MKKIKLKKNAINRSLRLGILIVLVVLIIISAYSVIGAYQQPTTKEETQTIPTVTYTHSGTFDFPLYLFPNSLFEDITVLRPGDATIFKQLIDYTDTSFTYRFQADKNATVQGKYKLEAQIQTDLWSKNYILTPETEFAGNKYTNFKINFPFNSSIYEEIVEQIEGETNVIVEDPTLILKCTIFTNAETEFGKIQEMFAPSIQIPLRKEILEFEESLSTNQMGAIETTKTITTQIDTSQQRTYWTIAIMLLPIIFIVFAAFTTTEVKRPTTNEKIIRKIQKKYGEWIVEAEKIPTPGKSKIISVKSFEDLLKISEEMGKPIIHYKTTTKNPKVTHTFYVINEDIHYKHVLPAEETITTTAKCPKCGEKVECEGKIGKTIRVICPNCYNNGKITITKPSSINPLKKLFANKIIRK